MDKKGKDKSDKFKNAGAPKDFGDDTREIPHLKASEDRFANTREEMNRQRNSLFRNGK